MVKKQQPETSVTPSSGNVSADLGFADPEEELTRPSSPATSGKSSTAGG
jgi:hypothetical protein